MIKIVTFGNCQAGHLCRILKTALSDKNFEVANFSNNDRTGDKKSNYEIVDAISNCDILIYQPLSIQHEVLSENNIKTIKKNGGIQISFPYIVNTGPYSLCHAPKMATHSYGKIFGEEAIICELQAGKSKEEIIHDYQNGRIEFNLIKRFMESLAELRRRECSTDIKISGFIENNYKEEKIFITHNHLSNVVFYEMIRQILKIVSLPIDFNSINKLNIPEMPETNCPISLYDIEIHGYKFKAHENWEQKGSDLICLIVDDYSHSDASLLPI